MIDRASKIWFHAGALVRRHVRHQAAIIGLEVIETRGWLSSGFVMRGTSDQIYAMKAWIDRAIIHD